MNLAEWIGRRFAPVLPRTRLARENMARSFPDVPPERIEEWVRGAWGSTTRMVGEMVFLDDPAIAPSGDPVPGGIEVAGIEHIHAIRDCGRPTVMVTAHTGNWEVLPLVAARFGLEVTALFRPPNNRFVAERLLAARRTASGAMVPSRAGAARALVEALERGGTVGLLADQWFANGVPVTFLGRKTRANPLAARLARRFDCAVVPARTVRLPGGRLRVEVEAPLDCPRDAQGRIDVARTTQRITDRIEAWVREHPDQWLWLHRRWK